MSLSKRRNPFKNTYRRFFHESKKDDFVLRLKNNFDSSDLNVGQVTSYKLQVLLPLREQLSSSAQKIEKERKHTER